MRKGSETDNPLLDLLLGKSNHQNGLYGSPQDPPRRASHHDVRQLSLPVSSHHNEVTVFFFRLFENFFNRISSLYNNIIGDETLAFMAIFDILTELIQRISDDQMVPPFSNKCFPGFINILRFNFFPSIFTDISDDTFV
jgi:hypothetical protein